MGKDEKDLVINRWELSKGKIDIGGHDLLVGFNEPAFKFSQKNLKEGDLDSKLSARFITYFLPLVQVARAQKRRPRMFVVSGLNMALRWNAKNDRQRKIMMVDNNLKLDFLRSFFEHFFPDDFSVIEYIVSQDPIKISEDKLLALWKILERKYSEEVNDLKLILARYKKPRLFGGHEISPRATDYMNSQSEDLIGSFKYAVSHLFALGDVNFEGNYIHNPIGYATVGGPAERVFNIIRELALKTLQDVAELLFDREVIFKNNLRLVIENETHAPTPYNGCFEGPGSGKLRLSEVTFENGLNLDYYDQKIKLKPDMDYLYSLVDKQEYTQFWNDYRGRYFNLKNRYREAYYLETDF
ncbi:MAG TPA: hypothetical protein VJH75_00310 [Patescibacteria group bacterium]|nr:hypothetical protein [Patescibacteria group bacterium]